MERLRWIFEIVDKISGPADAASKSIERVDASLQRTNTSSAKTESAWSRMGSAISKFSFAILPTVVAIGQISGGMMALVNLLKMLGVSSNSGRLALNALKNGFKTASTTARAFGAQALAALKRIPPGVYAAAAATATLYGAFRLAKAGVDALKSAVSGLASMLGGPMAGLGAAFAGIAVAAGVAKGAIDAMIQRDRQLRGLTVLAGGDQAVATRQRARFMDLSDFLGMNVNDVANQMQELLTKGFSEVEAVRIMQATADLGAITPNFDPSRMILAMSQIRQAGALQGDELNQLAESGLPLQHVYERIATAMGHTGEDSAAWVRAQRGQIPAAVALQGIMDGMRDTLGGGPLGTIAQQASQGLGGQLERLKNAPDRFFASLADMSGPMSDRIAAVVERLNDFFDPSTPAAQGMMEGILDVIDGILDALPGIVSGVNTFINVLKDPTVQAGIGLIWDMFRGILITVGDVGSVINRSIFVPMEAFTGLASRVRAGVSGLVTTMPMIGQQMMEGLANGIRAFVMAPIDAVTEVGTDLIESMRSLLGIHSPSKVFEELGMYTSEGFALGVEGGRQANVTAPGIAGAGGAGAGAFGFGGSLVVNINVDASGGDGASIASSIRDALMPELTSFFDGLSVEGGA